MCIISIFPSCHRYHNDDAYNSLWKGCVTNQKILPFGTFAYPYHNINNISIMAALRAKYAHNCVIPRCVTKGSNSFHRFPTNSVQREKWLKVCQMSMAKNHHRVCQQHFEKSDYCIQAPGRVMAPRLKPGVVPSLCLPPVSSVTTEPSEPSEPSVPLVRSDQVRSRPSIHMMPQNAYLDSQNTIVVVLYSLCNC
jgi:hypothetical protein